MESLSITIWHRGPTSYVIIEGDLDAATASRLQDAAEMVLETRPRTLHLDCRKVAKLTASGVNALLTVAAQARLRRAQMKLQLNERSRRIAAALCGDELVPWTGPRGPARPSPHSFLTGAATPR
ncbi:MAG: STAS domain-containing protein [Actinomycetota bacterium]|nr:STAS domain-containing protein [Actinomycetota bacterium]